MDINIFEVISIELLEIKDNTVESGYARRSIIITRDDGSKHEIQLFSDKTENLIIKGNKWQTK